MRNAATNKFKIFNFKLILTMYTHKCGINILVHKVVCFILIDFLCTNEKCKIVQEKKNILIL